MKKISWLFFFLLFLLFLGLFSYSLWNIWNWKNDSDKTKELIKEANKNVVINEIDDDVEIVNPPEDESNPYWDYIKISLIDVDFTSLKEMNKETAGWILVNGTNINYPFVQGKDNVYYLTHALDGSYNKAGWVFLDYRNNILNFDDNTIIYAHGRKDKTMFGSLKNILKSDWHQNKSNHIIKLSTEVFNSLWQIFSVYRIPTTNDYLVNNFDDDILYLEFLQMLKERSYYTFNTELKESDKILTLSTCYNDDDKVVMHAKLIKYEEKELE